MMGIRPWQFEFFTSFDRHGPEGFDPTACRADYQWYLDQWVRAEQRGFEGIFFAEHHFVPGRYSPSPNLLIAAVAARTTKLRLGAMGNVVPFYEPWRLAEEYAMLDQLSGGRLEIGLSSGSGPREFLAIGLAAEEIRPRFDEALDIIDGLLTKPSIEHRGRFWNFPRLGISPRPLQQPAPPRWVAGIGTDTAEMAARRGYRFCTGFVPTSAVRELFSRYRLAAAQAGHEAAEDRLGLRRMVYIDDDAAAARDIGARALTAMRALMGGTVADAPNRNHGGPHIADEEVISGNPDEVAGQIIEQCQQCGAGHFLGYSVNFLARAQAETSREHWREVNQRLRERT